MTESNNNIDKKISYRKLLPGVFDKEGVREFDESKIYSSLISETTLNESEAKRITEIVIRRIISNNIAFLSAPHIREIVCSILSEQHYEEDRKLYTRIGMPFYDLLTLFINCENDLKNLKSKRFEKKETLKIQKNLKTKLAKKVYRAVISELINVVKITDPSKYSLIVNGKLKEK